MKSQRRRSCFFLITVLFFSMLLSGCSDSDWEYLFWGLMVWGEEHSIIVNEEFQPGALAAVVAKDTVDDWMNSPGSVALDGLEEVRKIEMSNDLSDEALKTLDEKKMEQAIKLRPNDYLLYEKDAILWAARDNGVAAAVSLEEADARMRESLQDGDDCVEVRRAQLHRRLAMLWDEIKKVEAAGGEGTTAGELRYIYEYSSLELQEIDASGWTNFCSGFMD